MKKEEFINESGEHRVVTKKGYCYYIPKGWLALYWESKKGAPHFVK